MWRLAPGQQLAHRSWDGEHVVYNDLSGDTHLLDDVSMHLLTALQQAPRAEDALARAAGCAAAALESRLAGLAALSLIECIAW